MDANYGFWVRIGVVNVFSPLMLAGLVACGTVAIPSNLRSSHTSQVTPELASGVSRSLPLPVGTVMGSGYSFVGDDFRGTAVLAEAADIIKTNENAVTYDVTYIENYEDLAKSLNIDASASYSGLGGGVSASLSLFNSSKLTTRSRLRSGKNDSVKRHRDTKSLSIFIRSVEGFGGGSRYDIVSHYIWSGFCIPNNTRGILICPVGFLKERFRNRGRYEGVNQRSHGRIFRIP